MSGCSGLFACCLLIVFTTAIAARADIKPVDEAANVIRRTFGDAALAHITLGPIQGQGNADTFEYEASGGTLHVRGTSAVAIASGFYQYVRHCELGIDSWTGCRLDLSKPWPDAPLTHVETPYALRYYFNVVTFGYTMPYWNWARWEKEIDWMALHGVNMPLSLNATEAIATRVWKKLGLTQTEIDEFYTGPGHLPWQRMGNMANVDGPLSDAWHAGQIALEHQILDRERALGMHPIAQGFSGFVPRGLKRVYPDISLTQMQWSGFKQEIQRSNILSPDTPCFSDIGKRTVVEWQKEFGKNEYFLADSFNEMKLPTTNPAQVNALLERYGDAVYRSIAAGDPDARWVMQGWIFVYPGSIWTHDALQSLLRKVPDDKMVILDEAIDYSDQPERGKPTFEKYAGYFNKRWVAGYIPNMGGKTILTGKIDFYARGVADVLATPVHGRLSGIGIVPEGIENNEVLYELIADSAWQDKPVDLDAWLRNYARSRYGPQTPESVDKAFSLMRTGPYQHLDSQPHYSWQLTPGRHRQTSDDPNLLPAAEAFLAAAPQLKTNPLYQADAIEFTVLAAGGYAEKLINQAIEIGDFDTAARKVLADRALSILQVMDSALALHPTHRLDRWVDFAREQGTTNAEKDHYEANAKLLVSLWGHDGEISDYSARVWSGLIGGYYIPRWRMYFDAPDSGQPAKIRAFEKQWVQTPLKPTSRPTGDALAVAQALLNACHAPLPPMPKLQHVAVAQWKPADMSQQWKTIDWPISGDELTAKTVLTFEYTSGANRLDVKAVELLDGDQSIAKDSHAGSTGLQNVANQYILKADKLSAVKEYTLHVTLRSDGGTDSSGKVSIIRLAR